MICSKMLNNNNNNNNNNNEIWGFHGGEDSDVELLGLYAL